MIDLRYKTKNYAACNNHYTEHQQVGRHSGHAREHSTIQNDDDVMTSIRYNVSRLSTWAADSSGTNTTETETIDVNVLTVIHSLVVRNVTTGSRENCGVSEI